jgi:hypothetical protein
MTDSRLGRVWGLVAGQAARRGGQVSAGDACAAAVAAAAVSGAWLIAARGTGAAHLMQATDEVSELLAELELTLGEGPGRDAAEASGPVLASDLGDAGAARRWPLFAAAACEAGAAAVFAFPLQVGAIRAGVMGLYRTAPGPLPAGRFGDCLVLADLATVLLLDGTARGGDSDAAAGAGPVLDGQSPDLVLHRAEIDQATGMLTVQLGVPMAEAFARLRAYAYAHDRRLADVASDVVGRRLRLHADSGRDDVP